jgi:transcription termination/antitermination protein NusG
MAKKWFTVQTYSNYENQAKKNLEEQVRLKNLQDRDLIGEILIPMEQVVEMVNGEKKTTRRKLYPGYIFVQMEAGEADFNTALSLVKNTSKVTGFPGVGPNDKPLPMSDKEVERLTTQVTESASKAKPKVQFDAGDTVRVIDGPFANFNGAVEEVNPEKGRVRVLVSIFGRSTPVELDFMQVEKTTG